MSEYNEADAGSDIYRQLDEIEKELIAMQDIIKELEEAIGRLKDERSKYV